MNYKLKYITLASHYAIYGAYFFRKKRYFIELPEMKEFNSRGGERPCLVECELIIMISQECDLLSPKARSSHIAVQSRLEG